ncbi:hypothetical protein LINGRAHAP2_LOCUS19661 [Linum grandiflorum]
MIAAAVVCYILLVSFFQPAQMRPLNEEFVSGNDDLHNLLILRQSLQRGPVRGSGPNPCTNIGGRNPGTCTRATVGAMNFAGNNVFVRPPPLAIVAAD